MKSLEGAAGRLPPQQRMYPTFTINTLKAAAGRQPAAASAPKIRDEKHGRRCGQAARSSECTQDSR